MVDKDFSVPKLTFVVPVFNGDQFINALFISVLNQSNTNWQCIVVDDGSTDDSKKLADLWSERDSRFKVVSKKNGGLASARNLGISLAVTKYIMPLDSDDIIHKDLVTEFNKSIQSEEFDLISFDVEFFGIRSGKLVLPNFSYKQLLLQNCFIACSIFKKDLWTEVEGYDENLKSFEDWDFWIRALNHKSKIKHIPKVLYFYRKHSTGSLTNTFKSNPEYYFGLYDYVYTKNKKIYQENFPNPILAYQENEALRKFNSKVKSTFFFRLYTTFKRIIKK
ncbi:Glycosyltransferase involved in cell wall bisynthesis [Zunongwangia mangrovi]|uniref:Glycosyltransferase involved in cell wall bisynthesis n=1 Tax=Zunongwangia mangrovi TaxID=1334022 RepID=A0A1I1LM45_9FLAO|nr:glycosyltransferase [Zunongwangia mangrovi]SFC74111.1 Glycosyltransferase involved in cell wall bisynthesis [Zunongwangia mangrovi]